MARRPATRSTAALGPGVRVALMVGPERYLRRKYTEQLRDATAQAAGGPDAVDVLLFDGKAATAADVLDECRSFGLMQQHKIVVVEDADELASTNEARDALLRFIDAPADSATLVLRADGWRYPKIKTAVSRSAAGSFVDCSPDKPQAVGPWAVRLARERFGLTLERDAALGLLDRVGPDLARLETEVAKLAAAAGRSDVITIDDVREHVGVTREERHWEIQHAVLQGRPEHAVARLRDLLTVSRTPPILVRSSLLELARQLHTGARLIESGHPPGALRQALKLWGDAATAIPSAAARLGPRRAAELLADCVDADHAGKIGLGDERRTLESLAARFASALA